MQHAWFIGTFAGNNSHATGGMNYSFDGKIDDIRVYNRALNESEIQLLYDE